MPKTEYLEIWYRRKVTFRADPGLTTVNLHQTHVHVHNLTVSAGLTNPHMLEHAYAQMQGENWSRHAQAKHILQRRGIRHTSMSVGDVVVLPDDSAWECRDLGWHRIGDLVVTPTMASVSGM